MAKRQRLTSERARNNILKAAQKCLVEQGIGGLRMTTVAAEANIVHSSILHHFGSADGLKQALGKYLSTQLFEEMIEALSGSDTEDMALSAIRKLFTAFGSGGQANLLAWLQIANPHADHDLPKIQEIYAPLFERLIKLVTRNLSRIRQQTVTTDEARFIVYMVLIAACGHGIIGDSMRTTLGMDGKQQEFLSWFSNSISPARNNVAAELADL